MIHQCQKYNVICLHNWTYDLCIFVISSKTGFVDIVPLCCKPLIYNTELSIALPRLIHCFLLLTLLARPFVLSFLFSFVRCPGSL